MFDTAKTTTESSLLLWMLAAGVAMLAAYVSLGWVREAQRQEGWREQWKGLLLASASMGAGITSCMVLALSAAALPFQLGYPVSRAVGLWPLAMLACLPACAWLIRSQGVVATLGSGLLLAVTALGAQAAWLDSVGFRPGIIWRLEFMAAAGMLLAFGLIAGVWVSYSDAARAGRRRRMWRVGGATLVGLALLAGQEIFMAGAGLLAQVGSVYKNEVSAALLSLVAGVVVPLALAVMVVDLELRRRQRRRGRSGKGSSSAQAAEGLGAQAAAGVRGSRSARLSAQATAAQALAEMSQARTLEQAQADEAALGRRGKRRRRSGVPAVHPGLPEGVDADSPRGRARSRRRAGGEGASSSFDAAAQAEVDDAEAGDTVPAVLDTSGSLAGTAARREPARPAAAEAIGTPAASPEPAAGLQVVPSAAEAVDAARTAPGPSPAGPGGLQPEPAGR